MPYSLTLGRLFDIRVAVHVSWFVVFAVLTWAIDTSLDIVVPHVLGVLVSAACVLVLFASVTAHEFAHALVARRCGVRTLCITLFIFGGVATLETEPRTPRSESAIALAGPLMSALLAGLGFAAVALVERMGTESTHAAVVWEICVYLARANLALAIFNLLPAFPMDGGRVVRAILWALRRDHARATATASLVGCGLGVTAMVASATAFGVQQDWQFGWTAFVGAFITYNSWTSYRNARHDVRAQRAIATSA